MTISAAHMARGDNSPTNPLVPKVTYLCGPRGPEYRRAGVGQTTQVWWYCGARPEERRDGLGSVLAEVSPTGTITGARQADVYGAPRATQGTPTSKHAYVGALGHPTEDDSGLIYMRARWMDPVTGTFVSEDPGKETHNWYAYCQSDPCNSVDSSGLASTLLEVNFATAEDVGSSAGGNAAAQAVKGSAQQLAEALQGHYQFLDDVLNFGFDRAGNLGIRFGNSAGKETLFRMCNEGGTWIVKHTASGPNFGVDHHFAARMIPALQTILDALCP
ncbi:MAG: RHS repeat-associated core domain-containing protein [Armatimonadetes bacterium]|nr:RHS repeat-associated core domain-containing protein [Armatimonadota bacterium]